MELSTYLWITGIGLAFIAGRAISKKMKPEEQKKSGSGSGTQSLGNPQPHKALEVPKEKVERPIQGAQVNSIRTAKNCSSKQAFIKNIDFFLPLLPKLQHGIMDSKEWNSIILSINNPNLTMDWEKRCNLPIQRWIDKLASWGVSCEKCTSFKGNEYYVDKYEITSDSEMLEGKQYEVIDWYWVLTTINAEGVTEKKILLKGKAK